MQNEDLLRYGRHILLPEFGIEAQEKLSASRVLIIGAGGLGCPAALYLAAAGVGQITIADADTVSLSNLQRQILHTTASLEKRKVDSAVQSLSAINPSIHYTAIPENLSGAALKAQVESHDCVLDCTDNFAARYAINAACFNAKKPLVSGAAIRFDGQLAVFDFRENFAGGACYECLYPQTSAAENEADRCAVMGVFAPLTGWVGTLQAAQALQLLGEFGQPLRNQLLLINGLNSQSHTVKLRRDAQCALCA